MNNYEEIPLIDNEAGHQFELSVDGHLAFLAYLKRDHKVYLVHTEVPVALEGKGVAAALVEKTLKYLEDQGEKIVVTCSYVQHFLKRHPEWERLVA
jgi:uncharacterized protein